MSTTKRSIFSGMRILLGQEWVSGQAVVVEGSTIRAIIPENMMQHHFPAKHHEFSRQHYLVPGFIDLHMHGAQGKDVMDGDKDAFLTIARALATEGVTGYLATTMSAENERIEQVLKTAAQCMTEKTGAALLGLHLEGPFLAKQKTGAQREDYLQMPNITLFKQWQALAQNNIKMVTLAPELMGALEFIRALHALNITVSIGHTNATYDETMAAIKAGCSHATHLFNAMRSIHQREPGATTALLLADEVTAEIIVDGVHLHPAIVDMVLRLKGRERLMLITDAMRAKCLRDGQYELGGQSVTVFAGRATLSDGTLAGSTLRMPNAIANMQKFTHCSLIDAIHMATINPAYLLGMHTHKGSIETGKDADLVVLNDNIGVCLTMRAGNVIFSDSEHL